MVRNTSIVAYHDIMKEGLVGKRQIQVLDYIMNHHEVTDREISEGLGYKDPNCVRPRRKELLDAKLIIDCGKKICFITKRNVHYWRFNYNYDIQFVRDTKKKKYEPCPCCEGKGRILKNHLSMVNE